MHDLIRSLGLAWVPLVLAVVGCSSEAEPVAGPATKGSARIEGDGRACEGQGIPEIGCANGSEPVARCVTAGGRSSWRVACQGGSTAGGCTPRECGKLDVPPGVWGGGHARLEVARDGAVTYELDCGSGTSGPIVPDESGNFTVEGTYVSEGGPVLGSPPRSVKATYKGKVWDKTIKFTFDLEGSPDSAGPFTVTAGEAPVLTKCL